MCGHQRGLVGLVVVLAVTSAATACGNWYVEEDIWVAGADGVISVAFAVSSGLLFTGETLDPGVGAITAMADIDETAWIAGANGRVAVYDYDRTFLRHWDHAAGSPILGLSQVGDEVWIAADDGSNLIDRFTPGGAYLGWRRAPVPNGVAGLTAEGPDGAWVADRLTGLVVKVDSDGSVIDQCTVALPAGATIASLACFRSIYLPLCGTPAVAGATGDWDATRELWIGHTGDDTILTQDIYPSVGDSRCLDTPLGGPVRALLIRQTLKQGPVDFDHDGDTDLDDFAILKRHFGSTDAMPDEGDADWDGDVDLDDFALFRESFGRVR